MSEVVEWLIRELRKRLRVWILGSNRESIVFQRLVGPIAVSIQEVDNQLKHRGLARPSPYNWRYKRWIIPTAGIPMPGALIGLNTECIAIAIASRGRLSRGSEMRSGEEGLVPVPAPGNRRSWRVTR